MSHDFFPFTLCSTLASEQTGVVWGCIAPERMLANGYCDVNRKVYISFGGLLMFLDGPFKKLTSLRIDYVYLLIKK